MEVLSKMTLPVEPKEDDDVIRKKDIADRPTKKYVDDGISNLRRFVLDELINMPTEQTFLPITLYDIDEQGRLYQREDGLGEYIIISKPDGSYGLARIGIILE